MSQSVGGHGLKREAEVFLTASIRPDRICEEVFDASVDAPPMQANQVLNEGILETVGDRLANRTHFGRKIGA